MTVLVELPANLCILAKTDPVVSLTINEPVTLRAVLDALEAEYPMLEGTIREHSSGKRRAFIRYFACEQDLSSLSPEAELPQAVQQGKEPIPSEIDYSAKGLAAARKAGFKDLGDMLLSGQAPLKSGGIRKWR